MNDTGKTQKQEIRDKNNGVDIIIVFSIVRNIATLLALDWAGIFAQICVIKIFHLQHCAYFFVISLLVLFVLMIIGNAIIGCSAPKNRWLHLICTAIGIWLFDFTGYFFLTVFDSNFGWYLAVRVFLIVIPMFLGGVLSYLFKPKIVKPSA